MARPRQISDEQIREAGRKVFLEQGGRTSVEAVAAQLCVSGAALFRRVGSKEDLLLASLRPDFPPEYKLLESDPQPGSKTDDQLIKILVGLARFNSMNIPATFILREAGVRKVSAEPTPFRFRRLLAAWLLKAYPARDMTPERSKVLANLFLGTIEAHYLHSYIMNKPYRQVDARKLAESLVQELLS